MIPKAKPPAKTDHPVTDTINIHENIPITIEGILDKISFKKPAKKVILWYGYSARKIPEKTPIGIPINDARAITIKVPWIAGPIPPPADPNGLISSVKNSISNWPIPFIITSTKILIKGINVMKSAKKHNEIKK